MNMPSPLSPPSRSSYGSSSSSSTSTASSTISFANKKIDFKKLLTSYFSRYDRKRVAEIDVLLKWNEGKEAKLMLMLAMKYDTSNPLNAVYVKYHSRLSQEQLDDYAALTSLYLSIFRPSDLAEVDTLLEKYKGKEDELFSKLASNFHAINPLKIRKIEQSIDYKQALVAFYEQHDATKVDEVAETLSKCVGKEAIIFSVLAEEHSAMNGLDPILKSSLESNDCNDYVSLLQLYLSIFHPASTAAAESMLSRYGLGREAELFAKLAAKFRSTNPLSICNNGRMDLAKQAAIVKKSDGTVTKNVSLDETTTCLSSPAMIATR